MCNLYILGQRIYMMVKTQDCSTLMLNARYALSVLINSCVSINANISINYIFLIPPYHPEMGNKL